MGAPTGAPQLLFIVLLSVICIALAGPSFDFEDMSDFNYFTHEGDSTSVRTQDYSKGGSASLHWYWTEKNPQTKLVLNLGDVKLIDKELKSGGMKFWMYIPGSFGVVADPNPDPCTGQTDSSVAITVTQLDIQFLDTSETPHESWQKVRIHLGFAGSWRAVWIPFTDLRKASTALNSMDRVEFSFPNTDSSEGEIYIDLLRFVPSVSKPSRDRVVPKIVNPYNVEWSDKNHWQQTLRWSCQAVTDAVQKPNEASLLDEITEIENRLDNWYADKTKGLHNDGLTSEPSTYETFRAKRWKGLLKSIDQGNANYEKLEKNAAGDKIIGPALFTKVSELGTENLGDDQIKFTVIMEKILLPLALEYYLRSRTKEVNDVVDAECDKLASPSSPEYTQGLANIAGKSQVMKDYLKTQLGSNAIDCTTTGKGNLKTAVEALNTERLRRLVLLLEYVEVQGWTYGSGLGSIDHEMNKNGAGFMNGIFLLRKPLRQHHQNKLNRWMKTAKWYTDFNEIYQLDADYVYDGTTADRMRTILLYRMMIILMTNPGSEKIRDMEKLKTWAEHALKINKGLGGVIKPDYTGFHHMTFYAAAYVPHALHNAALVQYLLEGTSFALSSDAKNNLRKALEVMRVVAVKYSTPNSISGRIPNYNKAILTETTPAYAYISYVHATSQNTPATLNNPEMFLRLYDFTEPAMKEILGKGAIHSSIYYLNSIGALDIMEKVKTLAETAGTDEEDSPSGHWSKNFAALSIHRRNNWLVAAKGFSRYVWDYEQKENKENVYGVFVSYGSLQISNSEAALASYDVESGWDWTRIPGATTANFELANIKTKKDRYYNRRDLAGGVSLRGASSTSPQNGVFGMSFNIPQYEISDHLSPLKNIKFEFLKSYFFLDDLIVSVGKVLKFKGAGILQADQLPDEYYPQTTLFQDKLVNPNSRTSIKIDNAEYDLRILLEDRSDDLHSKTTIDLEDTLGNIYRFDNSDHTNNELHVQISEQKSKAEDGCKNTKDTYATAWIKHKKSTGAYTNYHYAILVSDNGTPGDKNNFDKFSVVKNDDTAYMVQFTVPEEPPEPEVITTGYVVFGTGTTFTTGAIEEVDSKCTIMTEEKDSGVPNEKLLHIAISNPAWKFQDDPVMEVKDTCTNPNIKYTTLKPIDNSQVGPKLLFCVEGESKEIIVTLRNPVTSTTPTIVWVGDEDKTGQASTYVTVNSAKDIVTFKNLKNGFTTEAVFKYTTTGGGGGGGGRRKKREMHFAKHVKARFRRAFNSTSKE